MSLTTSKVSVRRQAEIVEVLREAGRFTVEGLATGFATPPETIRRDLDELADARVNVRMHGGSRVTSSVTNLACKCGESSSVPTSR